jgi:hypothetical protein
VGGKAVKGRSDVSPPARAISAKAFRQCGGEREDQEYEQGEYLDMSSVRPNVPDRVRVMPEVSEGQASSRGEA